MKRYHFVWRLIALIILFFGLLPMDTIAQRDRGQNPKKQAKEQHDLRQAREKKIDGEMNARAKKHLDIQDRKTRKRMKRNRRRSERHMKRGNSQSFFQRLFRKRHFRKR